MQGEGPGRQEGRCWSKGGLEIEVDEEIELNGNWSEAIDELVGQVNTSEHSGTQMEPKGTGSGMKGMGCK